jgi:hypothetical protein
MLLALGLKIAGHRALVFVVELGLHFTAGEFLEASFTLWGGW